MMFTKHLKIKYILLLLFMLQHESYTQNLSVSGSLLSSETNEPVSYANISILNTNRGSVSNKQGDFDISFHGEQVELKFSCIGYKDTTIVYENSVSDVNIYMEEIAYQLSEVVVDPYTYAEKFILKAIEIKNKHNSEINYYENDVYAKTSFITDSWGIFGMIEAVSQNVFIAPDRYQEKLLAVSKPPNMKHVPYSALAIDHKSNLQHEYSEVGYFAIVNPLNNDALDYYNFYLKNEMNVNNAKITVITMVPKREDLPLFKGELSFNESYNLIEGNLEGNDKVADGTMRSLIFTQRFSEIDEYFNLPYFTSYSFIMNFSGLEYKYDKEINYTNYRINDFQNKPVITLGGTLSYEINPDVDIELERKNHFKIPLTLEENEYKDKMKRIFEEGSLLKKIFLFTFIDLPPLIFDMPTNLFGFSISKFANFYRFNKVDGHYLGLEKIFEFSDNINNYVSIGYSFAPQIVNFENDLHWKYYRLRVQTGIRTLGEFNIYPTLQTLQGLIGHEDNFNYYERSSVFFSVTMPLSNNFEITPAINFEQRKGMDNQTNFSLFNKDKDFKPNYNFGNYRNNYISLRMSFASDPNLLDNLQRNLKGKSSFLLTAEAKYLDEKLLNSSETLFSWSLYTRLYWEVISNIKANISLAYFDMHKSNNVSQYRFTNRRHSVIFQSQNLSSISETIPFFTLRDYQFTLNNYLFATTKINWFEFPQILNFRMSLATSVSYLKSYDTPDEYIDDILTEDLFEYALGIEGISFFSLYAISNNINPKDIQFRITFNF